MVERTNEENFVDDKRMFVSILNDVVELINKIVVNENDRIRLISELKNLDKRAEESIRRGLEKLGDDFVDR
jgi:hypothetical protein